MTTFANFQTMVLEVYKRTDKTTEVKRAINDAYMEMVACLDPRKQKDQIYRLTVVGREEYPIPDTTLRISHPVRLIDRTSGTNNSSESFPLHFYTKDEYDVIQPNPNAASPVNGRPHGYTFWKNSILLTDLPDKVYRLEINFGGEGVRMVGAGDGVIFSETWDETVKAGALSRLYAGIQLKDEADFWQTVYRFGFAGNEGNITGGLMLFRQLNEDLTKPALIVKPNDF